MEPAVLGISAFYHDSAAALLVNGQLVAAAQEERFTRIKHDAAFPAHAVRYVLEEAGLRLEDVSAVVFYDKPLLKFERLLETYHAFAPAGLGSFLKAMPAWIGDKLFARRQLRRELSALGNYSAPVLFTEHHLSHAASAFYPSPFEAAAILTVDGVGEWATTTIAHGRGGGIKMLRELRFPHSLGLLYSAFTYYCGFRVNSGEYKLMGLAPYGDPDAPQTREFTRNILSHLVDVRPDGSLLLNLEYFGFATGLRMTRDRQWQQLLGIPRREPESDLTAAYMNLARAIQGVTEEIVMRLARTARELTGAENLVMAGGVALNCVANGKLLASGLFKNIWVQPAAGDAGGALGAAYAGWYLHPGRTRVVSDGRDEMRGSYLGPEFSDKQIAAVLRRHNLSHTFCEDFDGVAGTTARWLADGKVVGWFQGRMEFGPRALGNRSILGDPRNPEMQQRMNLKIKYREGFRPFAPSVLAEDAGAYFQLDQPSPYMLVTAPVARARRRPEPPGYAQWGLYERLYHRRSDIPAVTHVDYSARVQTVHRETNRRYWQLLGAFKALTGYGLLVNTSFNVRGEPIVCTPEEACRCFMQTDMDCLVIGNFLLEKQQQAIPDKTLRAEPAMLD
ncbi:MAG: Nodulation protein nolO [uncultured Cytophagales bacterium]|uniref:Nodulation protein nolO n=1 Tax=uncultured Cytophagales bacterium TaxID=158755 RepID=A0A6J4KP87_9SPHI|nr:MAG: Nodulation protein nolO [uncultured Cytophagales bacterium]